MCHVSLLRDLRDDRQVGAAGIHVAQVDALRHETIRAIFSGGTTIRLGAMSRSLPRLGRGPYGEA